MEIIKSFVDDRNTLIIEEKKNLDLNLNASLDLDDDNEDKLQVISQYNEKVETDSLSLITGIIPEKSPENDTMLIYHQRMC